MSRAEAETGFKKLSLQEMPDTRSKGHKMTAPNKRGLGEVSHHGEAPPRKRSIPSASQNAPLSPGASRSTQPIRDVSRSPDYTRRHNDPRYDSQSDIALATEDPSRDSRSHLDDKTTFLSPSDEDVEEGDTSLFRQPVTKEITQDQLINEVKGIYAGLVMVEKKCVEIDQQQAQNNKQLSAEQWQALIALHRTLLHEHHDFFLASQHPSASDALRRLATKYAMPARMWR